jgi:O-antigen ligase
MMKVRRTLLFGSVAALVSVVILSQFTTLQDNALNRLHLLVDSRASLSTRTSGRFDLALGGWYIFEDHPFGVGTGGFRVTWAELGRREGLSRFAEGREMAAHAGWVKVLAENGLPGILLLGAYVVSFAVSGWRARNPELLRLGLLVSAILAVAWISSEFQNKPLWFLAAGATVLLDRKSTGGPQLRGSWIARG